MTPEEQLILYDYLTSYKHTLSHLEHEITRIADSLEQIATNGIYIENYATAHDNHENSYEKQTGKNY